MLASGVTDRVSPSGSNLSGADSVAYRIHREVVLLLGWGRAILLQLASPLVASAVADHSAFRTERWGRLRRLHGTLDAMLRMSFGSAEDAARVARRINAIHDRVHGVVREPAGAWPVGAVYSAHDPRLLRWVHATLVDSHLATYELYVGPLTPEEKDRYCEETSAIEPLLGIPPGAVPRSVAALRRYLDEMLASDEIVVTETARVLARDVVRPSAPWPAGLLLWFNELPTFGLLPPAIRDAYGFPWDARRERALRASATLIRSLLPWVPSLLRHWPSARRHHRGRRAAQRASSRLRG